MKINKTELLYIFLGALVLLSFGLYNGFPFVYTDTGVYIRSGFTSIVPADRPITYGWFIRHISMKHSLWFVAFTQNLLLSFVLFELFKNLVKGNYKLWYIMSVFFLAISTGMAWVSNLLMPDIFAPILTLSLFLILVVKNFNIAKTIFLCLLIVFSEAVHFSHMITATVFILTLLTIKLIWKNNLFQISLKRLGLIAVLVLSVWIVVPSINVAFGSGFTLSKGSHVFLLAHLNRKGVLKEFLEEHCGERDYKSIKLCELKDKLPNNVADFIWNDDYNMTQGGWEYSKEEFDFIKSEIISDPKYIWNNISGSIMYGAIQLCYNKIGEGYSPLGKNTAPYIAIDRFFNDELNNYVNSKQIKWKGLELKFKLLTQIQWLILFISMFMVIYLFASGMYLSIDSASLFFLYFIVVCIIINSLVTAGLSEPYSRYSSRMIWLFPLSIIIIISNNWNSIKGFINSKSEVENDGII